MLINLLHEASGRSLGVLVGMLVGTLITAYIARRRRMRDRQRILDGDARDTVVIHQHILDSVRQVDASGVTRTVKVLRVRTLGQSELNRVVPNGHLAGILLQRAHEVTARDTLISMAGTEGSYLLETLTNFVCDRVSNGQFPHEVYVMTACCEPATLSHHQPITILLTRKLDLPFFEDWTVARSIQVEHGSDGARLLSLMEMAKRFHQEQAKIAELRTAGKRTAYMETMYILDLSIDQCCADLPVKPVPWSRYSSVLKELNVEEA